MYKMYIKSIINWSNFNLKSSWCEVIHQPPFHQYLYQVNSNIAHVNIKDIHACLKLTNIDELNIH